MPLEVKQNRYDNFPQK